METAVDIHFEKILIPRGHLRGETHNPQQGGIRWVSHGVVFDVDAV